MRIHIDLHQSERRWPRRRPQRWWWNASTVNGAVLARSSETYTNHGDCRRAAISLFGAQEVVLHDIGEPDVVVRAPRPIPDPAPPVVPVKRNSRKRKVTPPEFPT